MSHRATRVPPEAHVWIVGLSILTDGPSMGGVQHQWIEERLEEKGTALMASNAHGAPLHFVHREDPLDTFLWLSLMSIWGYTPLASAVRMQHIQFTMSDSVQYIACGTLKTLW